MSCTTRTSALSINCRRPAHTRQEKRNIGSNDRLDFTVVGPAVNEVSRIAGMCRSAEQEVLVSSAFAAALGPSRAQLASVGRYALRGVGRAQELFTLERPEVAAAPRSALT